MTLTAIADVSPLTPGKAHRMTTEREPFDGRPLLTLEEIAAENERIKALTEVIHLRHIRLTAQYDRKGDGRTVMNAHVHCPGGTEIGYVQIGREDGLAWMLSDTAGWIGTDAPDLHSAVDAVVAMAKFSGTWKLPVMGHEEAYAKRARLVKAARAKGYPATCTPWDSEG